MEKFLAYLIVFGLVFTLVTTFYAIPNPLPYFSDCPDDVVGYEYTNKITGEVVLNQGSSSCPPRYLGFFWDEKQVPWQQSNKE